MQEDVACAEVAQALRGTRDLCRGLGHEFPCALNKVSVVPDSESPQVGYKSSKQDRRNRLRQGRDGLIRPTRLTPPSVPE